jgi:hypothetical protein
MHHPSLNSLEQKEFDNPPPSPSVSSGTDFMKGGISNLLPLLKGGAAVQGQTMAPNGWEGFLVVVRLIRLTAVISILAISSLFPLVTSHAQQEAILEAGRFSAEPLENSLPTGWKPLTFKKIDRHTTYTLIQEGNEVVVRAVAEASASGLVREIKINPKEYPVVQWRWKVRNILKKGDVRRKEGDDYPARIYITFEYDPGKLGFFEKAKYEAIRLLYGEYPPIGAINYIWESKVPNGTMVPNPFTDRVIMIVVESGETKLNQWVSEERNIFEDYKKAFGQEPPMISGVAIMTDTDNTGESATAYYGDIFFRKNKSQ